MRGRRGQVYGKGQRGLAIAFEHLDVLHCDLEIVVADRPTDLRGAEFCVVGCVKFTKNVSSVSSTRSPVSMTVKGFDVSPGANVSVSVFAA
jgi:hypothetical protein